MDQNEITDAIKKLKSADDFEKLEAENVIASNLPESLTLLHESVLEENDKKTKLAIIKILKDVKDSSSRDIFIKLLHDQNKWVRRESSTALANYGSDAVDVLLNLVNDPNWRARGGAIWALSKIGDEKALSALLDAANDEKSFVRSGAVFGLASIGGSEAIETLKNLSENDSSNYVKATSSQLLEEMN